MVLAAAVIVMAWGCDAGIPSKAGGPSETLHTQAKETGLGSQDNRLVIKVASPMSDDKRLDLMRQTIRIFERKYPDIRVDYMHDYQYDALKLAFSANEAPDVVYLDDLNQQIFERSGYLMNITEEIQRRRWGDREIEGALEFNNTRTPGSMYSVPFLMAPVVFYYNKAIFAQLKVRPPQTQEELSAILEKAKSAGFIPMENGLISNFQVLWMLYHYLYAEVSPDDAAAFYYRGEVRDAFKRGMLDAMERISQDVRKGYFRPDMDNYDYRSVPLLFAQGKSAMAMDGDWNLPQYEEANFPVGVFAFPPKRKGDVQPIVNATDVAWALNARLDSAKKAAALDFIDNMLSEEVAELWYKGGLTPSVRFDAASVPISGLKKEMNQTLSGSSFGFYLDNVIPGMLDSIQTYTQMLVLGEKTPEQALDGFLADFRRLKKEAVQ